MRRETITYLLALAFLALLATALHLVADRIVAAQEDTARIVNMSGRQRMLSQRIMSSCLQIDRAPSSEARKAAINQLREAIGAMSLSHIRLRDGAADIGIHAPVTPDIHAIYYDLPYDLDKRVLRFLDVAESLLSVAEQSPRSLEGPQLTQLQEMANQSLIASLDAAVHQYQVDGELSIRGLRHMLLLMLAIMLTALGGEALLIFRPLFMRLERSQADLLAASRTDPLMRS